MGNKADNLHALSKAGFRVPSLIHCPDSYASKADLITEVEKHFPKETLFAVRSSADGEDSETSSMAGYFYSALAVPFSRLFEEYSNVVKSYKGQRGVVIIQEFIPSEKAGVLFTNQGDGTIAINANIGLCKTVVEGRACDEYIVSENGEIISKTIAEKKSGLFYTEDGSLQEQPVSEESLSVDEVKMLAVEAKKIERFFKSPQDVEWSFWNGELYILQSRPITQQIVSGKQTIAYDSANIAESYSGIVKPLTLSFATQIYKVVYENLLIASGLSRRKVNKHKDIFDNMVASFYGRLYYNMNNWYLMMSFMPGYKRNKENLENLITSNISKKILRSVLPSIWLKLGYPFILIAKIIVFPITLSRFRNRVKRLLHEFRSADMNSWDIKNCQQAYQKLSTELLNRFHIPVENDFMMMTYLGILKKKYNEDELKSLIKFGNISALQIESIQKLSQSMFADSQIAEAIKSRNTELFHQTLENNRELKGLLNAYFEKYGGRFANELKLESSDFSEDVSKLMSIFELYAQKEQLYNPDSHTEIVSKKSKESFVLRRFKKYAQQREEMRLLRSNCFSIVRKVFNQLGSELVKSGHLVDESDIYYLTLEDVLFENIQEKAETFKDTVEQQRVLYKQFETKQPKTFFEIEKGQSAPLVSNISETGGHIQARSCTPGEVSGKAGVFPEFYLPDTIEFDILVAKHTDPGWTPLIGLSKGLVIEHGGILSHAAIVSRELGIPTVIGATDATSILKDGDSLLLNGSTGLVEII